MEEQHLQEIYQRNQQALPYIERFLQGDSASFHELIRLFENRVTHIVQKMIYSYHDAQDVVNDIWLKVAQNLHKFDPSFPFHSWLATLSSNTCIDFLRKRRDLAMEDEQLHLQVNKQATPTDSPEAIWLEKELVHDISSLLQQLDEVDRVIVTLRFTEEMSYDDIGEIVGMSKNTVGTRLFRARKQLKTLFEHYQAERRVPHATR